MVLRCLEIGLSTEIFSKLSDPQFDTYAKYAYCSSFIPGPTDEGPFVEAMRVCVGAEPSGAEMAVFRRLINEAHTYVLSDMRAGLSKRMRLRLARWLSQRGR